MRSVSVVASAVVVVMLTSGCSGWPEMIREGSQVVIPIADAKSEIFAVEDDIVAVVPRMSQDETVAYNRNTDSKVVFECDNSPGTYRWPGETIIQLTPGVDADSVLAPVRELFSSRSDWSVSDDPRKEFALVLQQDGGLDRAEGLWFNVSVVNRLSGGAELSISSFSRCATVPGEYDPFGTY